jgi:hypothetical protein
VFSQTHKRWVPILEFDHWRLTNSNEKEKELRRSKVGKALRVTQTLAFTPPLSKAVFVQVYL